MALNINYTFSKKRSLQKRRLKNKEAKMKKKILSFMLAFAFVLFVLPAGSTAVEEKSAVNGKDKKEAMEVVKNFISKAFSLQVENLEGLDLISKNAKDFEEYVKLRYKLNFGSQYKHESVNLEEYPSLFWP